MVRIAVYDECYHAYRRKGVPYPGTYCCLPGTRLRHDNITAVPMYQDEILLMVLYCCRVVADVFC